MCRLGYPHAHEEKVDEKLFLRVMMLSCEAHIENIGGISHLHIYFSLLCWSETRKVINLSNIVRIQIESDLRKLFSFQFSQEPGNRDLGLRTRHTKDLSLGCVERLIFIFDGNMEMTWHQPSVQHGELLSLSSITGSSLATSCMLQSYLSTA